MATTATVVRACDWIGLYIDGKCKVQGHRLTPEDVIDAFGEVLDSLQVESIHADDDWLEECCELPDDLEEVVREGDWKG